MYIADTHSDTLYAMGVQHAPADRLMITPQRLRQGGVTLQVFALWTGGKGNKGDVAGIVQAELSQVPGRGARGSSPGCTRCSFTGTRACAWRRFCGTMRMPWAIRPSPATSAG